MMTDKLYRGLRFAMLAGMFLLPLSACGVSDEDITTPVKIVAFGDSLTAGYNLPADAAFPSQLQQKFLSEGSTGVTIENQGISGDTTQDGVQRLNKVLDAKPDIVILELGANDILRNAPAEKARSNLRHIIAELQKANVTVILAGIRVNGIFAMRASTGQYSDLFTDLGEEMGVETYPHFLDGVMGQSELNLQDGLHPNRDGIAVIVENIYPLVHEVAVDVAKRKGE